MIGDRKHRLQIKFFFFFFVAASVAATAAAAAVVADVAAATTTATVYTLWLMPRSCCNAEIVQIYIGSSNRIDSYSSEIGFII